MELSPTVKALMDEALGQARQDGFVFVAVAFNENDNSIQFINNDGMSRAKMAAILGTTLEAMNDHNTRTSKTEKPQLYKGDA